MRASLKLDAKYRNLLNQVLLGPHGFCFSNSKSPFGLQVSSNMSGDEENVSKDVEPSGILSVHIGIKRGVKVSYLTFTYSKKRLKEQVDPAEEKTINQADIIRLSKHAARKTSYKIFPWNYLLDCRRNHQVVTNRTRSPKAPNSQHRGTLVANGQLGALLLLGWYERRERPRTGPLGRSCP